MTPSLNELTVALCFNPVEFVDIAVIEEYCWSEVAYLHDEFSLVVTLKSAELSVIVPLGADAVIVGAEVSELE